MKVLQTIQNHHLDILTEIGILFNYLSVRFMFYVRSMNKVSLRTLEGK